MTEARIENAHCAIAVDDRGAVTHLVNKHSGTDHIARSRPAGWKIVTTLGDWIEHPVRPDDNRGELGATDTAITVRFGPLTGAEGAELSVALEFRYELESDSGRIHVSYSIENSSPETVSEVWFPFLTALRDRGGGETSVIVPGAIARRITDPATTLPRSFLCAPGSERATRGMAYPGPASMGWVDASSADEGLYVASHDPEARRVTHLLRRSGDGAFDVGFASYPFVAPGSSYHSGPYAIHPHDGDWRAGADEYREFASGWSAAPSGPEWLRCASGVRIVFMKHQTGRVYSRYGDLPSIWRELQAKGLDRVPLLVFGWFAGGHDSGYPVFEPDDELGGGGELTSALAEVRDGGGNVILYVNGVLIDCASEYYASEDGAASCMKNREGVPYLAEYSYAEESSVYPGRRFALGCPSSTAWQGRLEGMLDRVMDLGASGILFDQLGGYEAHLCYDDTHGHATAAEAHVAKPALIGRLRERAASRDTEFGLMVEMHADRFATRADLIHSQSYHRGVSLPGEPCVEAFARVFPEARFTTRDAWDRASVNHAFVNGLVFECVGRTGPARTLLERKQRHEFDEGVLDRMDSMMRLRVRLDEHLLRGIPEGDVLFRVDPASAVARAYAGADGSRAVVVWNRDARERRVSVATGHDPRAGTWDVYALDGGVSDVRGAGDGRIEMAVGANDVAVAVERRE